MLFRKLRGVLLTLRYRGAVCVDNGAWIWVTYKLYYRRNGMLYACAYRPDGSMKTWEAFTSKDRVYFKA